MNRFQTQHIAGWRDASDAQTASLIDKVIADLERQAKLLERPTSNLRRHTSTRWNISDRD